MKALIFEGIVRDVCENEFEVHPDFTWVDCDETVEMGDIYDGQTFSKPVVEVPPVEETP